MTVTIMTRLKDSLVTAKDRFSIEHTKYTFLKLALISDFSDVLPRLKKTLIISQLK